MIAKNEYTRIENRLEKATLTDAKDYLQWLIYIRDMGNLDTTVGNLIKIVELYEDEKEVSNFPIHSLLEYNPPTTECTYANLRNLFDTAQNSDLRWPKIHMGTVFNLILQTNQKSQINITNNKPYGNDDNIWFGRIERCSGKLTLNKKLAEKEKELIKDALLQLDTNPAQFAKIYGTQTGHCMFCSLQLTEKESVEKGYGPICAKKFNLPWKKSKLIDWNAEQLDLLTESVETEFGKLRIFNHFSGDKK